MAKLIRNVFVVVAFVTFFFTPSASAQGSSHCQNPKGIPPLQDLNPDGEFRGGSIVVWSILEDPNGDLQAFAGYGVIDSTYHLITVKKLGQLSQFFCTYAWIPGTEMAIQLDYEKFVLGNGENSYAIYPLGPSVKKVLKSLAKDGEIVLLTQTEILPEVGDQVAMPRPDTGRYTYYKVTSVDDTQIVLSSDGEAGIVCVDRLGGPAQVVIGDVHVAEYIGVIVDVQDLFVDEESGQTCGTTVVIALIPTPKGNV